MILFISFQKSKRDNLLKLFSRVHFFREISNLADFFHTIKNQIYYKNGLKLYFKILCNF